MHEFTRYPAPSRSAVADLVRRNPFARVISGGDPPTATHTPVILPGPTVEDAVLLGHMARVNPQWRTFGSEVLIVFSGPHGYVSPTAYGYTPAVPTWNYAAVHVTGRVEVITDRAETLAVVEETVRAAESHRDVEWDMTSSRERFESLIDGVVAFRVHVRTVRSNFKLSQDMPPDVRERVRADQRAHHAHAVADLMAEHE